MGEDRPDAAIVMNRPSEMGADELPAGPSDPIGKAKDAQATQRDQDEDRQQWKHVLSADGTDPFCQKSNDQQIKAGQDDAEGFMQRLGGRINVKLAQPESGKGNGQKQASYHQGR